LAASQDLLVKSAWQGVDLAELVRSQIAHFEDLIGQRIELQGPPALISASAAQTIGMALFELATNSGKYGALSNACGVVTIAWDLERIEGEEPAFVMSWREEGGPPVTPPRRRGFGSAIIAETTEVELGAKVDLEYPAAGLRWQLKCPAVEVLEGSQPGSAGNERKPSASTLADSGSASERYDIALISPAMEPLNRVSLGQVSTPASRSGSKARADGHTVRTPAADYLERKQAKERLRDSEHTSNSPNSQTPISTLRSGCVH
jgi:hypothetical protein